LPEGLAARHTSWLRLEAHRQWLAAETDRLLDFAAAARVDGGFGWLDVDGIPAATGQLDLLITARMTHVFALGHLLGRPGSGPLVDHGIAALRDTFADREHGGWYAEIRDGRPVGTEKTAYEHAFVLLAASSAALADRPGAAEVLRDAADVVERRFWSEPDGLCVETWNRDWTALEDYRGANANMHMTEAFLAAGDATGDAVWYRRASRIAKRLIHQVAREHGWRLPEHFGADWRPQPEYNRDEPRHRFRPYGVTPGHGLEWSRLLLHIRSVLPDPPGWLVEDARALFHRAVTDGWQPSGGFVYTIDWDGRPVVGDRYHWVVAEAIGAAAALHQVVGDAAYERWYREFWDFAASYLLDRRRGGWRHELDETNRPAERTWPGKPDVYHALQATLLPRLSITASLAGALRPLAGGTEQRRGD
jgi:mannose/cellobiose epimerase-like protein (N-acyl-D-glucosamine 2-epimerase family)